MNSKPTDLALRELVRASLAIADRATQRLMDRAECASRWILPGVAA